MKNQRGQNGSQIQIGLGDSPTQILEKLKAALRQDGDFPVRARVVTELRMLVNDPDTSVGQVTEVILREPTLGTRVLHLVNSAFYQRANPIMTVSQAVLQLGMRPLSELCAGLVLMQRFVPAAQRGGIFADYVKKSILSSLITSWFAAQSREEGLPEKGYLAGTFFHLGHLLLAFYFPQIHEAAVRRAEQRGIDASQSITEILGITPLELNLAIVEALDIPDYYREVISEAHKSFEERSVATPHFTLANALAASNAFANAIVASDSKEDLEGRIRVLLPICGYAEQQINLLIEDLPAIFSEHCSMIEMSFLSLPDHVANYFAPPEEELEEEAGSPGDPATPSSTAAPASSGPESRFSQYIEDIKLAILDREPLSSIIATVMETMVFCLPFDRAVLLMADDDRKELLGRMGLGGKLDCNPKDIRRQLDTTIVEDCPEVSAFFDGCPQIFGDPMFEDGWPFAAIPIGGNHHEAIGVIYADKVQANDDEEQPLDGGAQASLTILAELLDQAMSNTNT